MYPKSAPSKLATFRAFANESIQDLTDPAVLMTADSFDVPPFSGVEVNGSAGLVFGGLAVRDADLGGQAAVPCGLVEVAFDGLLGAPP